jgi:hypothetical protein
LTSSAAWVYAALMWWGEHYGYRAAEISSGRRSAREQRRLVSRWDAGDRAGIAVRPAANSAHTRGEAFDLVRVPHVGIYGELSRYLQGVRWGGNFADADPLHFDLGAS